MFWLFTLFGKPLVKMQKYSLMQIMARRSISQKIFSSAVRDVGIYWFEEPFPEDGAFNEDFKQFIIEKGYDTLVADGGIRSSASQLF